MRLYVKLALFVVSFLSLASAGGEAGRECAWDVSFAARCYVADLLEDQRLKEQMVAEAEAEFQRRREPEGEPAMIDFIANSSAPAAQEPAPDALAHKNVAEVTAGDTPVSLTSYAKHRAVVVPTYSFAEWSALR